MKVLTQTYSPDSIMYYTEQIQQYIIKNGTVPNNQDRNNSNP